MRILARSRFGLGALALAILALVSMNTRPAHAFVYVVNTTVYSPSTEHCSAADGPCSLWNAIDSANINPGDDTIVFDQSVFTPGTTLNVVTALPYVDASEGITIDGGANGVMLEDVPARSTNFGLAFVSDGNAQNVTVNNIAVEDFNYDGIQVCPTPNVSTCDGDVDGVTVDNVTSLNNANDGVNILGANISNIELDNVEANINGVEGIQIIGKQTVTNVSLTGGRADENVDSGVRISSTSGLESNVTITGTEAEGNSTGFDFLPISLSGITIQNVTATSNKAEGISVRAFSTISGATISGSTVTGNQTGIRLAGGTVTGGTIKDNTVDGGNTGGKDGILVSGPSVNDLLVEGNTVTRQSDQGIEIQARSGGTGNTISGNTVTGNGGTSDGILVCCRAPETST